jgi:hypothetical protein
MQTLKELHPVVACFLIAAIAAIICVFVYNFFRLMRS